MSENYYIRGGGLDDAPYIHIGKSVNGVFKWAMPLQILNKASKRCRCCGRVIADDTAIIEDECGVYYTLAEFHKQIDDLEQVYDSIGESFA